MLLAALTLSLQSCLKDDDEVFGNSATERMTQYLGNARETLLSSEHGWIMEMYPEENQGYGGYAFTLNFTEDKVTVRSELAQDNSTADEITSLWTLTNDNGPVFTIDTYNELFHFFSTPWQDLGGSGYEAYQGEFEFVIMEVTDNIITLKGKKTGNILYLRRLNEPASQYLSKLNTLASQFIVNGLYTKLGEHRAINAEIDNDARQMMFIDADTTFVDENNYTIKADTVEVAFTYTDKGLRLYKEVSLAGKTFGELLYNEAALTVDAINNAGSQVLSLDCLLPKNYLFYDEIPTGDYTLRFGTGGRYRCDVTLEQTEDGRAFWLSGINERFKVRLDYVRATGALQMVAQELKDVLYEDGYVMWWCPLSATAGDGSRYFSWTTSIGMLANWNGRSKEKPTFAFSDNGRWTSFSVSAFFLAVFSGSEPTSDGYDRYRSNYMDPIWNLGGRPSIKKDDPNDTSDNPAQIEVAQSILENPYQLVKK